MMYSGIFSRTYPSRDISQVLRAIKDDGFAGAQMNLSSFGIESLPHLLDEEALAIGCAEAARLGVTFAALSGTYNMAHPDTSAREALRPRFCNVLRAAKTIGAPVVTLCTGSRNTDNMWAEHPLNTSSEAWADMRGELDWALGQASELGLILAIEPEPGNVVCDAKAARKLLDEVHAPHLKIILDAANLIGASGIVRQAAIVAEAVELLGPDIVLAHAKDINSEGEVVAPGQGGVDLAGFTEALAGCGFAGALVGHGFDAADSALAGRYLNNLCGLGA